MEAPGSKISHYHAKNCKHCQRLIYWDKTADGKWFSRDVYHLDGKYFIAGGRPRRHDCLTEQKARQDIALARATSLAAEISDLEIELLGMEQEFDNASEKTEHYQIMALMLRGIRRQLDEKRVFLRDTQREIECRQELLAKR